jgi:hypothetical protein
VTKLIELPNVEVSVTLESLLWAHSRITFWMLAQILPVSLDETLRDYFCNFKLDVPRLSGDAHQQLGFFSGGISIVPHLVLVPQVEGK